LLSFIPLCRFISSNVSDIELNYFGGFIARRTAPKSANSFENFLVV
jgi:hypothetical protein